MATDGASCEPDLSRAPDDPAGATAEAAKKDFDVDNLSKSELRMLLSVMEGELEARDLVIEALRARRKEVFIQERYGRFNLNDPFLALQRDYEAGAGDKEKPVCTNPLSILEAVMAHCRKMQERMSTQLAAAESRQKKLEMEKLQLQALEQEHKKLTAHLEEERGKNKHVVLMLVKECKQLSGKVVEESQKLEEVLVKLEEEKKRTGELEDQLSAEKQRSAGMEAQLEKRLSEFDTEREQLRAKLSREEAHTTNLKEEIDKMKKTMEQMKRGNDSKPGISLPRKTKDRRLASVSVATEGPVTRAVACQTDTVTESTDPVKKSPLTVPIKPSTGSALVPANTKGTVAPSALLIRPGIDRQASHSDLGPSLSPAPPPSANRIEENGPSTGSVPGVSNSTPSTPSSTTPAPAQTPGTAPQNHSQAPPAHSLQSPCANTPLHPGLNPRIQAARFRFQGNANDPDQNGNTTQSPPSRDVSPTSRDNLVAKQLARNTVTQALSRFTSPQAGASPRLGTSPGGDAGTCPPVGRTGLKTPGAARVDRGNPPPIPPKKPGLSQTPSPPHPQLRASNAGAKVDNKIVASPPSTVPQGTKVVSEENVPKSSSPQLPPKPSIDLTVAPAGCPVSALATSQKIQKVKCTREEPSCWSPSLTPLLMSGGPAPLAGRPTLLQQAAAQGNVTLLSMLLNEEGLDINYSCEDGHSALYSAAKNGHTDCVRLLLNAEARVDAADKNGFTPLCAAAAQGHFECIELLTAYDANINHAAAGGQTPLYLACKNGNKECIKLLLEAGTDRSIKTRDGWTPIHAAVDTGNVDSLKLLMYHRVPAHGNSLSAEEPKSGLFTVNGGESPPGTSKPVVPADLINHADKEGWTAAHIAASKGFKNCLEILCRHGGLEPERRDKCNRTVHDVATDDCKHLLENLNALKIPLRISVGEIQPSNNCSDDFECEHTICALNIRKQTSWDDFSKAVSQALTNHFQAISSDGWWSLEDGTFNNTTDSCIGLGTSSIQSIMLGNMPWSAGQSFPQPPWDFMKKRKVEQVTALLSGPREGCLSSVTYASMIPLQMLQNYLRLVEQYHNVIFHGPEGSLQDFIAHQLALCMKHRQMAAGFPCEIVRAEVDTGFSKEQLVDVFISSACLIPVKQSPIKKKIIVILENLEKSSLSELLGDFLAPLENHSTESPCTFQKGNGTSECYYFHENCFLVGTIAKACLQGPDLLVQQHFRWVQLRWDCEPIQGLLQRFLRRKVVNKFRGQPPSPCDPVCKIVDWALSVWRQLNSCLARLGTPEALLGPKYFLSCPVVPGHAQATVKWMSKLWNAVIAPRVQEAILSRASMNRQPGVGQPASKKHPSQGQQAVVKAALSILLNKAVLHGCPLPRAELDQYIADFRGGSFPLSIVSSYSKKKGDSGAWRKVNTSPRKKPGHFSSPTWNKPDRKQEGMRNKTIPHLNCNRNTALSKQQPLENDLSLTLTLDHRLSLGSDDEADLVKELQSMCSSKSESDISKIADSRDDLRKFDSSRTNPGSSVPVNLRMPVPQKEASPLSSHQTTECSNSKSKTELGVSRVKSFLPVPRSKAAQCSQNTKRSSSSSNTRQLEINNNSKEENWNLDKHEQVEKPNK
ncbi:cortactin-binding protein 2 isoform X3 [Peromyscus californicus insignis]|uniref:cortactin-binding protein 2 isoform X3 n=1 Tax=Peromyscus californicus insignis TaxID=564181 RepID=UPI0022A7D7E2|nr:cortactin-binding protein 2 isoform X3 [Peromyscus californicus insignis]